MEYFENVSHATRLHSEMAVKTTIRPGAGKNSGAGSLKTL